jgi:DNA topoisomerase IA
MRPSSTAIDANRLFLAADRLLAALHENEKGSLIDVAHDVDRHADEPPATFTETELVEAMDLLIRMGFAERK